MTKWLAGLVARKADHVRVAASRSISYWTLGLVVCMGLLIGLNSEAFAVSPFPRPSQIEPNVRFWLDVFSSYSERDFIIHDRDQVWRVYQVLHLPGEGAPSRSEIHIINDYLKTKFANILNRLAAGQAPADYEEHQVKELFKNEPPSACAAAAQNLRVQEGMREQFRTGLLRSRYYRSTMQRIFDDAGLPPELVALAQVESGFYSRARSYAGAVGIWQFTRNTGLQFMRISRYHDDRLDPATETEAAAQLLRSNYLTFGNWPLAITAYNYGTAGMEQAAEQYTGEYARIFQSFGGAHFGFASKNYYPEFLAAAQINDFQDVYFPDVKYDTAPPPPPVRTDFARPSINHRRYARRGALVRRAAYHRRHSYRRHRRVVALNATREAIE